MSRRKHLAARTTSGKIVRKNELLAPTAVRRLFDVAAAGLRDPVWSSQLGRLHVTGKITASEFAAGKHWATLVANYSIACQSPRAPRTVLLDATGGRPVDPDSDAGIKEARRHERASAQFAEGRHALRLAGREAERVVDDVVVRDQAPGGFDEMAALRKGLGQLSAWWGSSKRKP
jgi:hypothetical protein